MAVNAYAWTALWLYGSHRRRLLHASFPEEERELATLLFTIGVVMYTLAIGVAFLNAYAFLALQAAFAPLLRARPGEPAARTGTARRPGER